MLPEVTTAEIENRNLVLEPAARARLPARAPSGRVWQTGRIRPSRLDPIDSSC